MTTLPSIVPFEKDFHGDIKPFEVHPDATIIVRWYDASGPQEWHFGPKWPFAARISILTMGNDDWGKISALNPDSEERVFCSAAPADREAARVAIGQLVRL